MAISWLLRRVILLDSGGAILFSSGEEQGTIEELYVDTEQPIGVTGTEGE
jgi:hypothetical protein